MTAPGDDCDFVSRYFAPAAGIPEDPVTGSTHCALIPYWSQRLGKKELFARQISARGGELFCCDRGDRVSIGGEAVTYVEGTIQLSTSLMQKRWRARNRSCSPTIIRQTLPSVGRCRRGCDRRRRCRCGRLRPEFVVVRPIRRKGGLLRASRDDPNCRP